MSPTFDMYKILVYAQLSMQVSLKEYSHIQ